MLRYTAVLALVATAAQAQNPAEVERLCRRMVDLPEIVEIFKTCEPKYEQKRYAETPWKERVVALMGCLKSGKPSTVERQRTAIRFCFSELED